MFKKIVSLFLTMSFIVGIISTNAFAFNNMHEDSVLSVEKLVADYGDSSVMKTFKNEQAFIEKVEDDLDNLLSAHVLFEGIPLSIDSVKADGTIVYELDYTSVRAGLKNQVTVNEKANGDLRVEYFEDELHNILDYKSNGDIYLDGYLLNLGEVEYLEEIVSSDQFVANAGGTRVEFFASNGKPAAFSISKGSYIVNQLGNGATKLISIALGALATIICSAIPGVSLGSSLVVGASASVMTDIAYEIREGALRANAPQAYFSVKYWKWEASYSGVGNYWYVYNCAYNVRSETWKDDPLNITSFFMENRWQF